ncbi:MAG: 3-dehydroquinate synthase [Terrimicrobiaceae bacterium]
MTDSNVAGLHVEPLKQSLEEAGVEVTTIVVPAGESSKSMGEVARICDAMISAGLDRKSFLVALGGGVVGDLAGFVAAIFYRGIPFAQVPTTVLAQVDSSVGGKTGVNAPGGKNLIGAFHQPRIVIADTDTLRTLPDREFREGMAEVIKHGIIRDASLVRDAVAMAVDRRDELVARNVAIKAAIVGEDEFETQDIRALLNFGHTVGHAVEQAAGYGTLLHGEAISIGMAVEIELSVRHAGLPETDALAARQALAAFSLPLKVPANLDDSSLLAAMAKDKKFAEGLIRIVLTSALGSAFVSGVVTQAQIIEAISACRDAD